MKTAKVTPVVEEREVIDREKNLMEITETAEKLENITLIEVREVEEIKEAKETRQEEIPPESETTQAALLKTDTRALTTDFKLHLHTAPAYAIFTGEWAPGKMGLVQFGHTIQMLWQGFEQADPYAEWQLFKIHEAISSLKATMYEQEIIWREQVRSLRGLQIKPFRNAKPFTATLTSVNILVVMAGALIVQADYLIRQILILKQVDVVPQGQARSQQFCEDIQKVFMLSQAWKHTGVTRQDILDNTDKAKKAEKKFGQVPEAILYQQTTLPFLFMDA